ncbi:hypothetical protein C1I98_22430 [Spongiactinospora gelatinilytica]|uniref:Xylulose kinase n=1 Tax=Spongiactinospora gelatinilytica TaxID=2666298 RepID=A0A2W2GLC7_9ACTN|nr:FGGY family carbohydrate kinase [Spongiactinospora gelatinilytica]PZG40895.1 hypothetical protein C1I98_22430 [Spongiactinospora gelatinilytica]
MPLVAGIDSSTQSCAVELRDADSGALLGSGRAPHPVTHPPVSEQDPVAWWAALRIALAGACAAAGVRPAEIGALSVGAQCHGLVALDAAGAVIRPAKLWNDTTSARQAAALRPRVNWPDAIGLTPMAALTITKLAWLAEHEPENLTRIATVLLPHDWLTYRLTGERVTDRSDASGTGYYAAFEGRWRTDLLADGEVVAAGGGARSPAYRQVLADALDRPVITRDAPEATARGACAQAAAVLRGVDVPVVRDAWCPPTATAAGPRPGGGPAALERYLALATTVTT